MTSSSPNAIGNSTGSPAPEGTAANPSRFMTRDPSNTTAWHPDSRPLITVSATQDASAIATTESAAVPPSARISAPTSAVAGWPAATPARILRSVAEPRPGRGARVARPRRAEVAERPEHEEDPPEDGVAPDSAEVPAVLGERAVVSEHEVLVAAEVDTREVGRRDVVRLEAVHV